MFTRVLSIALLSICLSEASYAETAALSEALDLLVKMRPELCLKQKTQAQALMAHQAHDDARLRQLGSQMETITQRIKPAQDRLTSLKSSFAGNQADKLAFENAQLQLPACE